MQEITDTKKLRAFLVEQMNKAAKGEVESQQAKAVANFAQQIYNTMNIEIKVAVAKAKYGKDLVINGIKF